MIKTALVFALLAASSVVGFSIPDLEDNTTGGDDSNGDDGITLDGAPGVALEEEAAADAATAAAVEDIVETDQQFPDDDDDDYVGMSGDNDNYVNDEDYNEVDVGGSGDKEEEKDEKEEKDEEEEKDDDDDDGSFPDYGTDYATAIIPPCDEDRGWYGSKELGACYYFGGLVDLQWKNWFEAHKACYDLNPSSFLAEIRTAEQQSFVVSQLEAQAFPDSVYIAANDLTEEGRFTWGVDSPGDEVDFAAWRAGEPSDSWGGEDCVCMQNAAARFTWNDVPCDDPIPYLCQTNPE